MKFLRTLLLLAALVAPPVAAQTTSDTALSGLSKTVALTADDQAVTATGVGVIFLTSDNATATSRTFTLTASALVGHKVTLVWNDGTYAGELAVSTTQKLVSTWTPVQYDTLTLVSDGTRWLEVSRNPQDLELAGRYKTVTLTADNQAISAAGYSLILVDSDNGTATNRTATLTASSKIGQRLTLVFVAASNQAEIADTGIQKLSATWSPGQYDTLTVVSDGTNWIEVGRTDN